MAYSLMSVKCPDCGKTLSIESDRTQAFCTYCGAKVLISNENEFVFRQVDEAGIQQAETDRMVKLRQLRMDEKEQEGRKYLIIVWIVITVILAVIGIVGLSSNNDSLGLCLLLSMCVGMWGGLILLTQKKKKRRVAGSDEAVITNAMEHHSEKHYSAVTALFSAGGFRNVTAVPLRDLSILSFGKDGKVEDVTIDGESNFEEGDVFSRNAKVIITYHSKK